MPERIAFIEAEFDGKLVPIKFSVDQEGGSHSAFKFIISVGADSDSDVITIGVDTNGNEDAIRIPTLSALSLTHGCMSLCAVGAGANALVECFNKDVSQYIACLRGKGWLLGHDTITCVLQRCAPK